MLTMVALIAGIWVINQNCVERHDKLETIVAHLLIFWSWILIGFGNVLLCSLNNDSMNSPSLINK